MTPKYLRRQPSSHSTPALQGSGWPRGKPLGGCNQLRGNAPPPLCQTGKRISNISNNTFQKGASLIPWKGPWWLGRKDRQVSISKSICLSPISSCNSRAGLQEGTPRSMWCWKYCMCKYRLIIDPWKLWKFFTFPRYNLVFQSDNIYSHRPQSRRWRPTKSADEFLLNCTFGS